MRGGIAEEDQGAVGGAGRVWNCGRRGGSVGGQRGWVDVSMPTIFWATYDCNPLGGRGRRGHGLSMRGKLLTIRQTRRRLQCWRLQGIDLDTICVVVG